MINLYIHVPFCRKKCDYCAFYSIDDFPNNATQNYLDKIECDIAETIFPEKISTVFIGGGTPTLLSSKELKQLGNIINSLPLSDNPEITIEANPETLTDKKIEILNSFVNRISCGVQSFSEKSRKILGRNCSNEAIHKLETLPFTRRNCDLIFAIPGQTLKDWEQELLSAVTSGVDHISAYALTAELGTKLAKKSLQIDDDLATDMWLLTGEFLKRHGIERYEISNYSQPNHECFHNRNVWYGGLLYGYGPAAASYYGFKRCQEVENLADWLNGAPAIDDIISSEKRRREIRVMGLRTTKGWSRENYLKLPGATLPEWNEFVAEAQTIKNVHADKNSVFLNTDGLLFWNDIAAELL